MFGVRGLLCGSYNNNFAIVLIATKKIIILMAKKYEMKWNIMRFDGKRRRRKKVTTTTTLAIKDKRVHSKKSQSQNTNCSVDEIKTFQG